MELSLKSIAEASTCNPTFLKAEAGGLRVQGQPGLCAETLPSTLTKATKVQLGLLMP